MDIQFTVSTEYLIAISWISQTFFQLNARIHQHIIRWHCFVPIRHDWRVYLHLGKILISYWVYSYQVISMTNMSKSVDDDKRYDMIWIVAYNNKYNNNNMSLLDNSLLKFFCLDYRFSEIIYIRPILHVWCLIN